MKSHLSYKFCIIILFSPIFTFAQLPCITDNTGTLEKKNGQFEFCNGFGFHNEHRCIVNSTEISTVFTYGVVDNCDFVMGYPFLFSNILEDSVINKISGFSDINMEIKYFFLKREKISFAFKPGISIPSGAYEKGLGSGKVSGSAFLISTIDCSPILFNINAGYLQNANKCGDAMHIWHFSASIDYATQNNLHFICNTGIEKNPDKSETINPVFALLGLYYVINDNFEISTGYKNGVTHTETKHSFMYGLTMRF